MNITPRDVLAFRLAAIASQAAQIAEAASALSVGPLEPSQDVDSVLRDLEQSIEVNLGIRMPKLAKVAIPSPATV